MNSTAIRDGLDSLFAALTGIDNVRHEGRAAVYPSDALQAVLTYRLISISGLGRDEERVTVTADPIVGDTFDEDPIAPGQQLAGAIVYQVVGNRRITCSIKIEAIYQDNASTALGYIEALRDRIAWPSSRTALRGLGLGLASVGPMREFDVEDENGVAVSVGQVDLFFNSFAATSDTPITTIRTVEGPTLDVLD